MMLCKMREYYRRSAACLPKIVTWKYSCLHLYFFTVLAAVLSITSDPSDARVNEGLAVQFSCGYSETVPGPTDFMWRISDSSGIARMADQTGTPGIRQSGYQVITVKPSDAGNYTCVLTNEFATVASKPARLTVQCKYQIAVG